MFPSFHRTGRLGLLVLALAAGAWAQISSPSAAPAWPWLVSLGARSGYDSNLFQNNQQTLGGWEEQLTGLVQWQQATPTRHLQLQYRPAFQFVPSAPGLNSLNQSAGLNLTMQPAPRWSIAGTADASYWERMPTSGLGPASAPTPTAPLPLLPRTRAVSANTQLQLGYALSPRSTIAAFGGYSERRFPGAGDWSQALRGVRGDTSGLRYTFTASPRTQWGVELGQQNFGIGHASHLAAVSLLLQFQHALTPLTTVQFTGGPEYSQVHETSALHLNVGGLPITLTDRLYRVRTYPRLDLSLVHQSRSWPWRIQAGQQVSNGGGALPFPTSLLTASASVARRFSSRWQTRIGINASQFRPLDGGADLIGHVRLATLSLAVVRRLSAQMSLELDYQYFLQRSSGLMPLAPAVNRSIGGVRLRWQWPPQPTREGRAGAGGAPSAAERQVGRVAQPRGVPRQSIGAF